MKIIVLSIIQKFMINRLTLYHFNSERTFMEDRPNKKNLVADIPLITE